MNLRRVECAFLFCICFAATSTAQVNQAVKVARRLLPPRAELAELVTLAPGTFQESKTQKAVLSGHIVSPTSNDIVFAYYTPASAPDHDKVLFLALLHETPKGFVKLYEVTYYGRLLMRDVSMPGIRLLGLEGDGRHSIAIYQGIGASLGGQLEMLQWKEDRGLVNIMPPNGSVRRVSIMGEGKDLMIKLSSEKYEGQKDAPSLSFRWQAGKFVEIQ